MTPNFSEFDCTLRDGRVVHLRAMGPADEAELAQAFDVKISVNVEQQDRHLRHQLRGKAL